ncbi:phage holin family protein [Horticoccus luteus]|uniref:Phage holin family protein n=1 Tax=Horticoccus luteus TaxID=2862869 RepID=A0A8F9XLV2_9BACT|nr:phage holin family protein [Horticoccus luteus]QYM79601.1 phage holin family protein [Horticoccus luteus]
MANGDEIGGGTLDSVRRLGQSVLGLLQTRVELVAVELQEQRLRTIDSLVWLAAAMGLAIAAVLVVVGALALWLWQTAGYAGLAGLAVVTAIGAGFLFWHLRRRILHGPQPFEATVEEFRKDLACLRREE